MGDVKKSRFEFLQRFLNKEGAEEFDNAVAQAEAALAKAGVANKEAKAKGLLENLQASFMKPLDKLTDDAELKADLANKFIAMAMGAFSEMGETAEEVIEELPEAAMMEDEEEEKMEEDEDLLELGKAVVDLAIESTEIHKELQALVPAFIGVAKTVEALAPLVEKSKQVNDLENRIKQLEKLVSLTPRAASKSDETVVVSEGLQTILEKSTQAPSGTVWGHEVKPEVN